MSKTLTGTLSRGTAVSALLVAGLLSGCGVAGTGLHPGVAAEVGDDSITVAKVDDLAIAYCSAIKPQLEGQVVPHRYLRGGVAGQLALASAARQLAEEYDVGPGDQYDLQVGELRSAVADLPEDQRDAVVEVESASAYVTGVTQSVGEELLRAEGTEDPQPADATLEGQQALAAWLDDHEVSIDPQLGIAFEDGQPVAADTGVSFAVGETAKKAGAEAPDQEYAGSLPAAHRCG